MSNGKRPIIGGVIEDKPENIIDVTTLLDEVTIKTLEELNIKDTKIKNEKQLYAESKFFLYKELNGKIYLTYDSTSYLMPDICNSDFKAFKIVVDFLVELLKPSKEKSRVPIPETKKI